MKFGYQKLFQKRFYLLYLSIVTLVIGVILKNNPQITEQFYSQSMYLFIGKLLSNYSGIFPFAIFDVSVFLIFLIIISTIVLLIKRKLKIKKALWYLTNLLLLIYIGFYWLWGFNYYRSNFNERFNIPQMQISDSVFNQQLILLIEKTNTSYAKFKATSFENLHFLTEQAYTKHAKKLGLNYPQGKRIPKQLLLSTIFSASGTLGHFGPFYNEIHLNQDLLPSQMPVVMAHEKAHQFGITSEAEANFFAWYVCTQGNVNELKYSGNLHVLKHFLRQAKKMNPDNNYIKLLDSGIVNDIENQKQFWKNKKVPIVDKISGKIYNIYLKLNCIPDGVKNYSGVTKMIIDYNLSIES